MIRDRRQSGNLADYLRPYCGVRVVVLGSTGFIGGHVARQLCKAGAHLMLPARDTLAAREHFRTENIYGEVVKADLGNAENVRALFRDLRPAITFNLAGYGIDPSERDTRQAGLINHKLIYRICRALAETRRPEWCGQAIVHAGSAMEYGRAAGDLDEGCSSMLPTTLYGITKLYGSIALSKLSAKYRLKSVTARLFSVYGPGEPPKRLLPSLISDRHRTGKIPLTAGLHRRDFVHVEDAVEGLLRLGTAAGQQSAVNVASGRLTSVRIFVETSADILGIGRERLAFGLLPTRPEEMDHDPVTNSRLLDLTGWVPSISIEEGIKRTISAANLFQGNSKAEGGSIYASCIS